MASIKKTTALACVCFMLQGNLQAMEPLPDATEVMSVAEELFEAIGPKGFAVLTFLAFAVLWSNGAEPSSNSEQAASATCTTGS